MNKTLTDKLSAFILTSQSDLAEEVSYKKISQFVSLIEACDISISQNHFLTKTDLNHNLYFIDLYCSTKPSQLSSQILQLANSHKVILFNADESFDEKNALLAKVAGVFYCADRVDVILKGIECIKNGELWFKSATKDDALSAFIYAKRASIGQINSAKTNSLLETSRSEANPALPTLTKREKTIINLVSSGAKNKEIADKLHISPNTVKTHIYSIFRKTSSRNRIELITWNYQLATE
jgi:DNA-binding NarL/FixJ family response regulator